MIGVVAFLQQQAAYNFATQRCGNVQIHIDLNKSQNSFLIHVVAQQTCAMSTAKRHTMNT